MAADMEEGGEAALPRGGDRRDNDRRSTERRKSDRRTPLPWWRRPAALVSFGAAGALMVVLMWYALGDDDEPAAPAGTGEIVSTPPPTVEAPPAPQATTAPQEALTTAAFEALVLEGAAARGRLVKAQLYCDQPAPVGLVQGTDTLETSVAGLADADGRVPAAMCRWGSRDDPRREDFILLVPQGMAGEFARADVVMDGYVRRRRLVATVEWVGETRALALRTAGVFRGLEQ